MDPDVERPYAALYWTYPVPWAGFNELPKDADEAAARSRTVRYQRNLVRNHVAAERGTLLREFVFLEVSPDHATDAFEEVMPEVVALCGSRRVCLCYVNFGDMMGWRKHDRLRHAIDAHDLRTAPLHPLKLTMDGERFDPKTHFRTWRTVDKAFRERQAMDAGLALAAALDAVPVGYGRNVAIAERLNAAGVRTHSGKEWTPDNVRMAVRNLGSEGGARAD